MGITVTADAPTGLSDKEVLALMRNELAERGAIAKKQEDKDEADRRKRLDTLDQLALIADEKKRIEGEIAKFRPKLETARRSYEQLADQNAELCRRLDAAARRESEVSTALIGLGECYVWDNVNRVQGSIDGWTAELRARENELRKFKWDVFDRRYLPAGREIVVERIDQLNKKLAAAPKVQKDIAALAMARISPRELIAKIDELLAKVGGAGS